MADIPGIIEGASEGKGLGLRFLRHIERNALLLFMISCESDNIINEYHLLLKELIKYNEGLGEKKRVLAITKSDLIDDELKEMLRAELPEDLPVIFISSVTGYGMVELKDLLWKELNRETRHEVTQLTHRNMDVTSIIWDKDEEELDNFRKKIDAKEEEEEEDLEEEWDDETIDIEWLDEDPNDDI